MSVDHVSSHPNDPPVLWQLRISHYNEKARWALDYKQIPHRRVSVTPGVHSLHSWHLGGKGTTPLLVEDDKTIGDSSEIIAEAERISPEPPLYPSGDEERKLALDLSADFDQNLGPGIRCAYFHALLPDKALAVAHLTNGLGRTPRIGFKLGYPLLKRAIGHSLEVNDANAEAGRAETVAALDTIEARLGGRDYLVGDRFGVADLTAAALLFPLTRPEQFPYPQPDRLADEWVEFQESQQDRAGYAWALEMYRRHRGTSSALDSP